MLYNITNNSSIKIMSLEAKDSDNDETTIEPTSSDLPCAELRKLLSASYPCKDRKETIQALKSLVADSTSCRLSNVYGEGPMLVSDIPANCIKNESKGGVILGIDEAGRGPVLGPMTYAAAYWHPSESDSIPKTFNDSKQLSSVTRNSLFETIQSNDNIGFVLRVIHASEISRNMLRAEPYNLNAMSHDTAIQMIRAVLKSGVKIDTCYIDTVGIPESYRKKLEREFLGHEIKFVVEKKADALYAACSAASVIAKVSRDSIVESWVWTEPDYEPIGGRDYGSGYPSDPKCKDWMKENFVNPVFCFPDIVRFSWGPAKLAMKEQGVKVEWQAEEEDEENANQMKMNSFLQAATGSDNRSNKKRKRFDFFDKLKLNTVDKIIET